MISNLYGWELFSTPQAFIYIRITWAIPPMAPQFLGVILGSLYAHDVARIFHGKVRNNHPHQVEPVPSSTIFVIDTPILRLPSSFGVAVWFPWGATPIMHFQIWHNPNCLVLRWSINKLGFLFQRPELH